MIVDNPLPPAPASMSPGRVCSPADETDSLRGEGIAAAKPLFMDAETCCIDAASYAMRLTSGRQKATEQHIA